MSGAAQSKVELSSPTGLAQRVRDEVYYYRDGSCVFLVKDRLFKVHRSIFEADSAFFRDLFSLPQPNNVEGVAPSDGSCDETLIICHDTIEEFRALCWALYAKPTEIVAQLNPDKVNVPRMILVTSMAQKYDFPSLRDWAFDAFETLARCGNKLLTLCASWARVEKLFSLARICEREDLAMRIEQGWLNRITRSATGNICFISALDAAERGNLRQFHGKAYYFYLKAIGKFNTPPTDGGASTSITNIASFVEKEPVCKLSDERKLRLFQGFWSLMQLRYRLNNAPTLDPNPQCRVHASACQVGWESWWKAFLKEIEADGRRLDDPNDLFQELQQRIMLKPIRPPNNNIPVSEVPCHALIKTQVCAMRKQFEDTLADHFMIPVEQEG